MQKLPEFQEKFLNDVISGGNKGRMKIYENNAKLLLRDHLVSAYAVTTILLGDDFMHQSCDQFIKLFPPASGDLNEYGGDFADFLAHHPNMRDYAFVPDTARLEWLAHECYLSPRPAAITADDLVAVADPLNMQLPLQPHVRLLRSGWPVDELWSQVNTHGSDLKDFALKPTETFVMVYRNEKTVGIRSISEGAYVFLEYLQLDPRFAFAAEAALRADPTLKLDETLASMVAAQIFCR